MSQTLRYLWIFVICEFWFGSYRFSHPPKKVVCVDSDRYCLQIDGAMIVNVCADTDTKVVILSQEGNACPAFKQTNVTSVDCQNYASLLEMGREINQVMAINPRIFNLALAPSSQISKQWWIVKVEPRAVTTFTVAFLFYISSSSPDQP